PEYATRDLSRIRLIINVAPPDTLRKMQEQMPQGVQVTAYGSTEMGGVACFNELSDTLDQRVTTSGRPFPGIELRIAGPDGQTLG
ncbi:AMP-binding protein, partial [Salmonella sp. SAL4435]|uniref:AMP-binding protein n=1 Tax=Salmonella sp. SAL4435 TaxID=3159890 RepID=UPI003979E466